jgi:hypothetical protein
MSNNRYDRKTRRRFLSAVGATGVAFGVGNVGAAGINRQGEDPETHYRLGGRVAGWQGREPQSVSDTVNPTLNLEEGTLYAITWVNVDGAAHNIAILSQDGSVIERTEIISEQGASQTLQFTAAGEMATYVCQVHPNSMVGDIVIGGGAAGGAQETTVGNRTATNQTTTINRTTAANQTTTVPNPTEAEVQETTHPLADQYGENPVKFVTEMEPPQGVGTEATGTTWFTLHPPNGAVAKLMYSLYVQNVQNVTSAHIHLDSQSGNPAVANLFQPNNPVDEIEGTLVDSILTAEDLVGPFESEPLLRLTEAIRNDNVYVDLHTRDQPDGVLAGPIRAVEETANGTTIAENETTTMPDGTTANGTTADSVDTNDIIHQVRAPGFGGLSALGGLTGVVGYLLSRGDGDD